MSHNVALVAEDLTAGPAAEAFDVRVYQLVRLEFVRGAELLRTFTAEIRLHGLVTN